MKIGHGLYKTPPSLKSNYLVICFVRIAAKEITVVDLYANGSATFSRSKKYPCQTYYHTNSKTLPTIET